MREDQDLSNLDRLLNPPAVELGRIADADFLRSGLEAAGLDQHASELAAHEFSRCASWLLDRGLTAARPVSALFVPGRIEVLGKHTDYAAGGSLICALQRGVAAIVLPIADARLRLCDARSGARADLALSPDQPSRSGEWSNYAIAVGRRLARDFAISEGAEVIFSSGLPSAAGMSSSSALTVAFALSLGSRNGLLTQAQFRQSVTKREGLAQYLGAVENGLPFADLPGSQGVGTFGGSEDHTAILCSDAGWLKWYMYCPVRFIESVQWPEGYRFVLAVSGARASKTREVLARYNYLSETTAEIARMWQSVTGRKEADLGSICGLPDFDVSAVEAAIAADGGNRYGVDELMRRLRHFHQENNVLLPQVVRALREMRLDEFGLIVDKSQELADLLLQNQIPETVFLAREARNLGALAASAFGAGFGGSVWAMVAEEQIDTFPGAWSQAYSAAFPRRTEGAEFFVDTPGPAAFWLSE